MQLIDADAFEMDVQKCVMFGNTAFIDKYEVLFRLHNAPTIDAVPVVRCKECKHKGGFGCPWWKGEDIPTDWYCANGERMTDATD